MKRRLAVAVALIAFVCVAIAAAMAVNHYAGSGADNGPPVVTIPGTTVPTESTVTNAAGDEVTVTAPPKVQENAVEDNDHQDLRSQTPEGVTPAQLSDAQDQQEEFAQNDQLPLVSPDAAPTQAGCTSHFVQNFSSRGGVKPRLWVIHYTVSNNAPGWADVNAITNLFNTWSFQASSNFVFDYEGHCAYIVRTTDKAWTQATFNPVSVSVEVIANGREGHFVQGAALAKLGRIIAAQAKLFGIPLQKGAVSGCTVTRPGIVDHHALGACGGGHVDITPYSVDPIIKAAQAAGGGGAAAGCKKPSQGKDPLYARYYSRFGCLTKTEQAKGRDLLTQRRAARAAGSWSKAGGKHLAKAKADKAYLVSQRSAIKRLGLSSKVHRADRYKVLGSLIG